MQLRFGTGFQTEIEFLSMADDLLNYRPHLIDLDRIDDEVFAFVFIFFGCFLKAVACLFDAVIQNIGKAHQNWCRYITERQFFHQFFQIYFYAVFTWCDIDMSFLIDTKVVYAPSVDVVKFF